VNRIDWIDQQAARVLDTASASPPRGDAAWDALLGELGVKPLSPAERDEHFAQGPKRKGGAAPIEVRLALAAIHDRAHAEWRRMDIGDDERRLAQRLSSFVDEHMAEYLKRTAPAPTTSSIFANARATTPNYGAMGAKAGMNQMKCVACGAPRKNDGDALTCVYCGGKLQ
jgi:hypothetical protein